MWMANGRACAFQASTYCCCGLCGDDMRGSGCEDLRMELFKVTLCAMVPQDESASVTDRDTSIDRVMTSVSLHQDLCYRSPHI